MAEDITGTYKQAKEVFNTLSLKQDVIINIDADYIKIFRKHLSELIRRKHSAIRFTTRKLNKKQLRVIRID